MRDILDSISAFILALWGLFLRVLFVCGIATIIGLLLLSGVIYQALCHS